MAHTAPDRPVFWPHFTSTVRSTALTARLGVAVGIAFTACFVTGLLSAYQYAPWEWLPIPAAPVWGYRFTQGLHVLAGIALVPLLLVKLWSIYPNLFRWPPVRSVRNALERLSVFVLVATTLVQLVTGFLNVLNVYSFGWFFPPVHFNLAWVILGSVLLHVGLKLPDIRYGLQAKLKDADVLTEVPWEDNPDAHSNAGDLPAKPTPAISRRGVLAAAGTGVGLVVLTTAGSTVTPLRPFGLLAIREPDRGPQGVPINRTAEQAKVGPAALDAGWRLQVDGPRPYALGLADLEALATTEARLPINCVEGWSANADWAGLSLLEVVRRAGGGPDSRVRVVSVEKEGYISSMVVGPQLPAALLATHINGERLNLDHGFPLRLIAPNRPGVLQTKWLGRIEVS